MASSAGRSHVRRRNTQAQQSWCIGWGAIKNNQNFVSQSRNLLNRICEFQHVAKLNARDTRESAIITRMYPTKNETFNTNQVHANHIYELPTYFSQKAAHITYYRISCLCKSSLPRHESILSFRSQLHRDENPTRKYRGTQSIMPL